MIGKSEAEGCNPSPNPWSGETRSSSTALIPPAAWRRQEARADVQGVREAPAVHSDPSLMTNPLQSKPRYALLGKSTPHHAWESHSLWPGNCSPLLQLIHHTQIHPRPPAATAGHALWLSTEFTPLGSQVTSFLPTLSLLSFYFLILFFFNNVCTISLSITRELIKP